MRRKFLLFAAVSLTAGLLAVSVPAQAQITADQLNKLSLEALTAPPPRPRPPHRVYSPQRRTMDRLYRATMRGAPRPIQRHATTSRHRLYTRS